MLRNVEFDETQPAVRAGQAPMDMDWLQGRTVDPNTVLMLTFGAILFFFGGLYLVSAEVYETRSLVMLGSMLFFYVVIFAPWHRILQRQRRHEQHPGDLQQEEQPVYRPRNMHELPVPARPLAPVAGPSHHR